MNASSWGQARIGSGVRPSCLLYTRKGREGSAVHDHDAFEKTRAAPSVLIVTRERLTHARTLIRRDHFFAPICIARAVMDESWRGFKGWGQVKSPFSDEPLLLLLYTSISLHSRLCSPVRPSSFRLNTRMYTPYGTRTVRGMRVRVLYLHGRLSRREAVCMMRWCRLQYGAG